MKRSTLSGMLMMLAISAFSQRSTVDARLAGLDEELERIHKAWKAAGFAVAIVEKDRIVYERGFGVRDLQTRQPVTPHTLFAIGSCTKAFTATLLGQLAEEGKVKLDEPAVLYIPGLRMYNDAMQSEVTLRDMMCHRTGLPRHDMSWYFNPTTRDSLVMRVRYLEPTAKPRARWQYNNFMYLLQGVAVEKQTGLTWEQAMEQRLLKPLGMNRSGMPYEAIRNDTNVASPHAYRKDSTLQRIPHYNIGGLGPAGSVYSSVHEMSRWVRAWIHGGKWKGKQVIPAAYRNDAITAHALPGQSLPDSAHPDIHSGGYGLGWSTASYRGHYRVEHGGAIDGFIASTCFFPTDSVGIIVLTNQDNRAVTSVVRNIISDRMLRLPRHDWQREMAASAAKAAKQTAEVQAKAVSDRVKQARPTHTLAELASDYHHPGYGTLKVRYNRDSLWMHGARDSMWLEHWHYNTFVPHDIVPGEPLDTTNRSAIRLQFQLNPRGEVSSLEAFGLEDPAIRLVFDRRAPEQPLDSLQLSGYTGTYMLPGMAARVYIGNDKLLTVEVPGQPPYALIPEGNHRFRFRDLPGFSLQFEKNEGQPANAVSFIQPNGTFRASRQ